MMYDRKILENLAIRLYKYSYFVIFVYVFMGAIISVFASTQIVLLLGTADFLGFTDEIPSIISEELIVSVTFFICMLSGGVLGAWKSRWQRIQAQLTLCIVQIELNTGSKN